VGTADRGPHAEKKKLFPCLNDEKCISFLPRLMMGAESCHGCDKEVKENICRPKSIPFMENKVTEMERRADHRIKITEDSFVTERHSEKKLGRIIDISRGGLAFSYRSTLSMPGICLMEFNIWLQDQNLFLPNVVADTISDIQVEYRDDLNHIQLRRRSVRFCNLSFDQMQQIHSACSRCFAHKSFKQEQAGFHFHPM
jgi:c-di-GMP-binding flagellar brake protein YcgR